MEVGGVDSLALVVAEWKKVTHLKMVSKELLLSSNVDMLVSSLVVLEEKTEDLPFVEPLVESVAEKLVLTSSIMDCSNYASQEEEPWTTVLSASKSWSKKKTFPTGLEMATWNHLKLDCGSEPRGRGRPFL